MIFDFIKNDDQPYYADVVLPLAIQRELTYSIPQNLKDKIALGLRVEVSLKSKLYSGLVIKIHQEEPVYRVKSVISVLDEQQIIFEQQLALWQWMASYYCCTLGEVMSVALPSGLKLSSETRLIHNEQINLGDFELSDDEYLVSEALQIQKELTIQLIQDILNKKTVYPIIRSLLDKRILFIKEELIEKFKPKKIEIVELNKEYEGSQGNIEALDLVRRSDKQTRALLSLFDLSRKNVVVSKASIREMSGVDGTVVNALCKKGIVLIEKKEISRLRGDSRPQRPREIELSEDQQSIAHQLTKGTDQALIHLLHGVTGSGKTSIYISLIKETIKSGGQVLYLIPEIALTSQIVERLEAVFDKDLLVYHSKINNDRRVEIWKEVKYKRNLVIGARSSVFLPFHNLKLIIVDEEHDSSYKQDNPNPRYSARDTASYLSRIYNARVILGSATPSLESFQNVRLEKYDYSHLAKRYGDVHMPVMQLVDLRNYYKSGKMFGSFSPTLKDAIEDALERKEQVILFQNRRGYAPILKCVVCGWTLDCSNCDVSLTYHQRFDELKCHYCGFKTTKPLACQACGSSDLHLLGLGTQKIEEEIRELFPAAKVKRFDYDTANTRRKHQELIYEFESRQIDILVGTQMISKGFDFENISLVGVLNADALLGYPDFRAEERTFQLLTQVSGRSGRRSKQGRVIIQTFNPGHPVLQDVIDYDIQRFCARELKARSKFTYPPFFRLINVWFRHKQLNITREAARIVFEQLIKKHGKRIGVPHDPPLLRVRGRYQQLILIKIEKKIDKIIEIKSDLLEVRNYLQTLKAYRSVRVGIDVDPY